MQKRIVLMALSTLGSLQASNSAIEVEPPPYSLPVTEFDILRNQRHQQSVVDARNALNQLIQAMTTYVTTLDPETVKKGVTIAAGVAGAAAITHKVAETPILSDIMALIGAYNAYCLVSSECKKFGLTDNAVINWFGFCAPVARCGVNVGVLAAACSTVEQVGLEPEKVYIGLGVLASGAAICRRVTSQRQNS